MAVGLSGLPELYPVSGVRLGSVAAGIKHAGRDDVAVIECCAGTESAAVFTRNRFCAAPVVVARRHMAAGNPRFCLINSGNANAGTGEVGIDNAVACCEALAHLQDCATEDILPFSTGVVGQVLPVERVKASLKACVTSLNESGWPQAATAIMTTDTVPKGSSKKVIIAGEEVTITGIAKGAGMIRPDMATMLAFIATDATVAREVLQEALGYAVNHSFNRITVDGDTSTNDACVLFATGRSRVPAIKQVSGDPYTLFRKTLTEVCIELAQAIIRDAEGVTKFITIEVVNGKSEADCLAVAYTVAHSPLVKTAFFASDPNWGRILAAVGRAGVDLDIGAVSIYLDHVCVASKGTVAADYTEAAGQAVMDKSEITVRIDLGAGDNAARIWTSDLSHEYVRINAEYRT